MRRLTKTDRKTGKKFLINIPTWDDLYVINANVVNEVVPPPGPGHSPSDIGTSTFAISASCENLTLTSSLNQLGFTGVAYSEAVGGTLGLPPYSYALVSGDFPIGLSLNGVTGVVSGIPTEGGVFPVTIRVTDANECTRDVPLNLYMCAGLTVYMLQTLVVSDFGTTEVNGYYTRPEGSALHDPYVKTSHEEFTMRYFAAQDRWVIYSYYGTPSVQDYYGSAAFMDNPLSSVGVWEILDYGDDPVGTVTGAFP